MRLQIACIHTGHLGMTKCRPKARSSVWWAGLSKQIREFVTPCHTCAKDNSTSLELLMPSSFPVQPWKRVATKLYNFHIIVVDYWHQWTLWRDFSFSDKCSEGGFRHTWHLGCHNVRQQTIAERRDFSTVCRSIPFHTCYLFAKIPLGEWRSRKGHWHSRVYAEKKRRHYQRPLDLQINSPTEWLLS